MSLDRTDVVRRQYEQWRYPEPIQDLPGWLRGNWQWFDPSHSQHLMWPEREPRPDLDILVAGCGTNQAAVLAHTNPQASVTAIDISQDSLNHQQFLKDKYGLWNLQLHHLPIEDLPSLDSDYDLIVCTGVLHHLHDPVAGLATLRQCLRPDGVIGAMVYAKYGRFGVELLETLFRDLGLGQDTASLRVVKDVLALLPAAHPARSYLQVANDGRSDAVLVDTFLHGRARHYTVADCLELVENAGLAFQGWLLNAPYHPHPLITPSTEFYPTLDALAAPQMWSAMERINTTNGCHFFMATNPHRPPTSYTIDFTAQESLDYTPSWRMRCGLGGREVYRPDWTLKLTDPQRAAAAAVDGTRSIGDIAAHLADANAFPHASTRDRERFTRNLFRELWRLDFLAIKLSADLSSARP